MLFQYFKLLIDLNDKLFEYAYTPQNIFTHNMPYLFILKEWVINPKIGQIQCLLQIHSNFIGIKFNIKNILGWELIIKLFSI